MPEKTAEELRAELAAAFEEFMSELKQCAEAWEKKPGGGSGEDAWCPREVAEHVAGATGYFAAGIARALDRERPKPQQFSFATADEAIAATPAAQETLARVVAQLSDADLAREAEFGQLGKRTVGEVVGIAAHHLRDHANQIRSIRTS